MLQSMGLQSDTTERLSSNKCLSGGWSGRRCFSGFLLHSHLVPFSVYLNRRGYLSTLLPTLPWAVDGCACDLAFACLDGVGSWEADSGPGPASASGRPAAPGAQACSFQYYCFFLSWQPTTPSLSLTGFVHEKAAAVVGLQWCWYRICTQDQVYVGLFRDLTFCPLIHLFVQLDTQYLAVLIIVALLLKSGSVNPLTLLIIFKVDFGPLLGYRISISISNWKKKAC